MSGKQTTILIILIVYLVANVALGLIYGKKRDSKVKASTENKYFMGGRGMNGLILAMTTMATYTSVSSFVSGPGAAGMTYGYSQVWVAATQIPCTFMVLGVLGNKLALVSRRTGAVTVAGYLKARYKSDALVIITSIAMVAFMIVQMISQFKGGATLIEVVTGLDYKTSLWIFALVVIVYTSFGGFTSVVVTDTMQGLIMCLGTILLIIYVLKAGNGLENINRVMAENINEAAVLKLNGNYATLGLLSFWILVGFGTIGLPSTAVRAMGFKNTKSLHSAMWIGCLACILVIAGMHLAGAMSAGIDRSVYTEIIGDSDHFIPTIVLSIMPTFIGGIFLAAPLAAVMSTVSSLLIICSAAIVKDLWRNYVVKDDPAKIASYNKNVSKVSIIMTFVIGFITVLLTANPPAIIWVLNLFAMGGQETAFFWPLVAGLFYKKGTKQGAVASSVIGTAVYVYTYYNPPIPGLNAVVWGLVIGGIVYFAVSAATFKGLDKDVEEKCF